MNLLEIEIDGFGVWTGLKLDDLSQRLTAFYGPNEAGKTTLLEFVRTMLYGFSPERRRRYLPPFNGGRAGGSLRVGSSLGRFTIARHADDSPRTPAVGALRVLDDQGASQNEQLVDRLLGRVDEATFVNVFAVGLREVQELGALGDTAAAELLYGLSTGLDRVSLVDVLRELKTSRERLLSSEGKPCQIANLLAERERLLAEIDELRSISHRYAALVHQRGELDADLKRREEERGRIEHAVRVVEAALAVREAWGRRAELHARAEHLLARPSISPHLAEQIEALGKRLAQRRGALEAFQRERRTVRKEIAALGLNRALARCAPRIEALHEQETWIGALETQVDQLSGEVAGIETELSERRRRLGAGKDHRSSSLKLDERTRGALRPLARALRAPQAALQAARLELESNQQKADAKTEQIREALAGRAVKELAPALERAGKLVTQLRRRAQIDERLSQMSAHDAELGEQNLKLEERQLLPPFVLWGLAAVFALGMAMLLWGGVKLIASSGKGGEAHLVFGLLFCAAAAASKYLLERSAVEQLEAGQGRSAALVAQIKQIKEERTALDAELPRGAGPWLTRLQAAEKELASLEGLMGVDAERQGAQREADAAGQRIQDLEQEHKTARRRWRNALAATGLPKGLSPKEVRHLSEGHQDIRALQRRLKEAQAELGERRKEFDALAGRVAQVMDDAEIEPDADRVSERLKQLRLALADHEALAGRRETLERRLRRIQRRQTRLSRAINRRRHRQQLLLVQAGVENEEEFRRRIADAELAESLRGQHAAATREIAAALGVRLGEDDVRDWLEGSHVGQLENRWEELTGDLQTASRRLQTLFEERGRVQHELKSLADDRRLPERSIDLGVVEQRLREAIEQWQVVAVAGRVLDKVRKLYEAERQPETLQQASKYLDRLTDGRYPRVWTPLGENVLVVDDADGRRLPVEALSRGTREQLFLGLRLALVASYARRGVELPLVLDDVLVNFDARRAKAAAAVLRDFAAEGHQLFVFTCHEHVWKLFKNLKLPARALPDHDDLETATVAYQAPEDEPEPSPREDVARWRPDVAASEMIRVEDDDFEEEADEEFAWEEGEEQDSGDDDNDLAAAEDGFRSPPWQPPAKVKVVRSRTRGGPFDNALWFEPVEDDLDDEQESDDEMEGDDDLEDDEIKQVNDAFADADDSDEWDDSGDDDSDDDVEAA